MRLVARLQDFGDLLCLVVRPYGETVRPAFTLVQTCESESWVEHLCRSTERDCEPVQETVELLYGSSTSSMSPVEGGGDLSTGEGDREETLQGGWRGSSERSRGRSGWRALGGQGG